MTQALQKGCVSGAVRFVRAGGAVPVPNTGAGALLPRAWAPRAGQTPRIPSGSSACGGGRNTKGTRNVSLRTRRVACAVGVRTPYETGCVVLVTLTLWCVCEKGYFAGSQKGNVGSINAEY